MAVLTVQDTSLVAVAPNMQALASGGDSFPNNGLVLAHFKSTAGAPIVVTADDVGTPAPAGAVQFDPNVTLSVPATTGERVWGPFPPWRFNDANGRVNLTYGTNPPTGLTLALYRLRP